MRGRGQRRRPQGRVVGIGGKREQRRNQGVWIAEIRLDQQKQKKEKGRKMMDDFYTCMLAVERSGRPWPVEITEAHWQVALIPQASA